MKPHHQHDCSDCVFLGTVPYDQTELGVPIDVWWCRHPKDWTLDSVIGRYGSEPWQYLSSHPPEAFCPEGRERLKLRTWYRTALGRAIELGLYRPGGPIQA